MTRERGHGLMEVRDRPIYGRYVVLPDGLRIRVPCDDWHRLGVLDGERVEVDVPGWGVRDFFVAGTTWVDGWYWVEFVRAPVVVLAGR